LVQLKGMVCEMILPMLKAWLDDKLPAVVERLVRLPAMQNESTAIADSARGILCALDHRFADRVRSIPPSTR
jgi:hypothetical protein